MMAVSAEHHLADENHNKAVIGDKLMYGESDPEPGIMITQTHTHTHTVLSGGDCEFGRRAESWSK